MNWRRVIAAPDIWEFCESIYAESGVESLCLRLQDEQDVNVLILLWCAWLELLGEQLPRELLATASAQVAAISDPTLMPLRQLRRQLKNDGVLPADVNRQVRRHLCDAELAIEKHLLLQLQKLHTLEFRDGIHSISRKSSASLPLDAFFASLGLSSETGAVATLRTAAKRVYG